MNPRKLLRHLRGKTDALNPAKPTLRNIYAVLQAWFRQKRRSIAGMELSDHMYEQIIYRRTQVMLNSPKCWRKGDCLLCGCELLGKTMEDRACEGGCYPEMMNAGDWATYKKLYNINLFN
jgi:hypothetical protein